MKTKTTKKTGAQNSDSKTNAPNKPTNAPTKGAKAKNTTARKTNTASKTSAASTSANPAKAIEALCRHIEAGQRKLESLLNTTIGKVGKSLDITKTKLTKLTEQEKKNKNALKTYQAKHKTKPTASTEAALKKSEQAQRDIAIAREKAQTEQTILLSQLRHYQSLAKSKSSQKNTALKPSATKSVTTQSLTTIKSITSKSGIYKANPPASSKKPVASKAPALKEVPAASFNA